MQIRKVHPIIKILEKVLNVFEEHSKSINKYLDSISDHNKQLDIHLKNFDKHMETFDEHIKTLSAHIKRINESLDIFDINPSDIINYNKSLVKYTKLLEDYMEKINKYRNSFSEHNKTLIESMKAIKEISNKIIDLSQTLVRIFKGFSLSCYENELKNKNIQLDKIKEFSIEFNYNGHKLLTNLYYYQITENSVGVIEIKPILDIDSIINFELKVEQFKKIKNINVERKILIGSIIYKEAYEFSKNLSIEIIYDMIG